MNIVKKIITMYLLVILLAVLPACVGEDSTVDSFTEEMVLVKLEKGGLIIKGKKLHVQRLDLQEGKVAITGEVESVLYTEKTKKKDQRERKGLLKRLFGQSA